MVHGAWCMVHSTWTMAHGAWCVVCGVLCMVHGAWSIWYLHHALCTTRNVPCTMLCAPRIMGHVPCTANLPSCTICHIPYIMLHVPCSMLCVSIIVYNAQCTILFLCSPCSTVRMLAVIRDLFSLCTEVLVASVSSLGNGEQSHMGGYPL